MISYKTAAMPLFFYILYFVSILHYPTQCGKRMSMTNLAEFTGYVHAVAAIENETTPHPLQTRISFVLTDFEPNINKQAVPRSEAENIIATAKGMPIKINFNGISEGGHNRAVPVGPIMDARLETIEDREVIMAEAVLWKDEFEEIDDYLKSSTAESKRVGTSWELYYRESEEIDGIEWLRGIVMAGTAIVKDPAYQGRTPILAVAEMDMEEKIRMLEMQNEELRLMLEGLRLDIEKLEMEHEKLGVEYSSVKAERDALVQEKELEKERQEAETRLRGRQEALAEVGIEVAEDDDEMRAFLTGSSDDVFNLFIRTHKNVKPAEASKAAEAEVKVPGTIGNSKPKSEAVIEALSKYFERGK
jgi:hypothetical protein